MKIKVIVLHYGDDSKLSKSLNCLKENIDLKEVTVVNNNPNTLSFTTQAHIIHNPANNGYAGGMNVGIKSILDSDADYILLLTNDITFDNNFVHDLSKYLDQNQCDICGVSVLDEKGKVWFNGGEIDKNRYTAGHTALKTDYISGCLICVKKQVFKTIGLFDENYFMYYEDADLCTRAKKNGVIIKINSSQVAYHATSHSASAEKNMQYYLARNHIYFLKKHAPLFIQLREYARLPKTISQHITKKEYDALQGVVDGLRGKYGRRISA
jgi:GT2 family glycosyltransferase